MNEVIDLNAARERAEIARSNADAAYREMRENPPLHEAVMSAGLAYGRRPNIEPAIISLEVDYIYAKRYDLWSKWAVEIYAVAGRLGVKVRSINFVTGCDLGFKYAREKDETGKINEVEIECWGSTFDLEPLRARLSMDDEELSQWGIEWANEWPTPLYRRMTGAALAIVGVVVE